MSYEYELLSKVFYKNSASYEHMYRSRFNSETTIKAPIAIHDYPCFFIVNMEMINKMEKIFKNNSNVNALLVNLPPIAIKFMINKSLKDEITLTNEIEGVSSTRKEIEDAILNQNTNKRSRFKGLTAKYIKLIENDDIPLDTCEDIRIIYDDLVLDEIDEQNEPDGTIFRKEQVHIVSSTQREKHSGVMPEEKIIEYMKQCLTFLKDDSINTLIKTAAFHYLFGYIHPFYDGNGRTSRFISSCLLKSDLGILLSLRLSYVIKDNIKKYYEAFDVCNDIKNRGDITYFILMFLDLLIEATNDLYNKLNDLSEKLDFYVEIISGLDLRKNKKELLFVLCQNALFGDSLITVDELSRNLDMSTTTVRGLIKDIEERYDVLQTKYGKKIAYTISLKSLEQTPTP